MKIKIKYNKTAQFFFYLSNFANWHFSCAPEYNKIWLKKIGALNKTEKELLKNLEVILKKYDFDDKSTNHYLGKPFIDSSEDKIWKNVENWVNKHEYQTLKKVFDSFESKLNILWKKDKERADKLAPPLNAEIKRKKTQKAMEMLEKLFNQKINYFIIHFFVIPGKSTTPAGGANTKKGVITLELRNRKDISEGIFIALHEITHHLIRNSNLKFNKSLIENKKKIAQVPLFREQGLESAWEEAVLICFLPDGFIRALLTNQYPEQKKKLKIESRNDFENYLILQTKDKIEEYSKKNKQIDQEFANFVLQKSEEFIDNAN